MADGKHEAIIDEKYFMRAQKKKGSISRREKDVTLKILLLELWFVAGVGAAMIMKKYTDKRNKNNKRCNIHSLQQAIRYVIQNQLSIQNFRNNKRFVIVHIAGI